MVLQIAIEGCCHGELDKIYETMQQLEKQQQKKIDLLICCGDFQVLPVDSQIINTAQSLP